MPKNTTPAEERGTRKQGEREKKYIRMLGLLNPARHLGRMAGMILAELTTKSSKQSQLSVFQVFLWDSRIFLFFGVFLSILIQFAFNSAFGVLHDLHPDTHAQTHIVHI